MIREESKMGKIKERIGKVLCAIALIVFAWLFASLIDINIHNGDLDHNYASWNFFEIASMTRTN